MIVMESDSMMMTAYAATWCSHSPFVKALLTPDDRMKPRPMFVPVETHLSTAFASAYRPYFWNSQSRLSSGHTWRVLSHREMQWKWKACYALSVASGAECRSSVTYVADAPGDGALFARGRSLVGLALDAEVHDVITADGAVVDDNVPSPESYSVPLRSVNNQPVRVEPHTPTHLLDFEALLVAAVCAGTGLGDLRLGRRRIGHIDVRHGCGGCGVAGSW